MLNEFIPAYRANGPAVTEVTEPYEPRHRLEPSKEYIFQEAVNFLLEQLHLTESVRRRDSIAGRLRTNGAMSASFDNGARAFATAGMLVKDSYGDKVAVEAAKEVLFNK